MIHSLFKLYCQSFFTFPYELFLPFSVSFIYSLTVYYDSIKILASNTWLFFFVKMEVMLLFQTKWVSLWVLRGYKWITETEWFTNNGSSCWLTDPKARNVRIESSIWWSLPWYFIMGQKASYSEPECEGKKRQSCPSNTPTLTVQDPLRAALHPSQGSSSYQPLRPHLQTLDILGIKFPGKECQRPLTNQSMSNPFWESKTHSKEGDSLSLPWFQIQITSCVFLFFRRGLIYPSLVSDALYRQGWS